MGDLARVAAGAPELHSSALSLVEMGCVFRRHVREDALSAKQAAQMRALFLEHVRDGIWRLIPASMPLLQRVEEVLAGLPADLFIRAGDALHLVTAQESGFSEIWSNDRHLLAAAPHFGLRGRSV